MADETRDTPSQLIDARIEPLGDWRGATLARRAGLGAGRHHHHRRDLQGDRQADLRRGALDDRARLFNASLDGNVRRAIDLREGDVVDKAAFTALVRGAAALNGGEEA